MMIIKFNQLIWLKHIHTEKTKIYQVKKKILIKQYNETLQNLINFDDATKEDIKEPNPNWLEIPDYPCRIVIVGGSGSGRTNVLLNLLNYKPDIDKKNFHAKDPEEAKYQLPFNKRKSTGLKYLGDSKAFIEYSNNMDALCKNIEESNPNKKR